MSLGSPKKRMRSRLSDDNDGDYSLLICRPIVGDGGKMSSSPRIMKRMRLNDGGDNSEKDCINDTYDRLATQTRFIDSENEDDADPASVMTTKAMDMVLPASIHGDGDDVTTFAETHGSPLARHHAPLASSSVRFPCKARNMPQDHDDDTAYIDVPHDAYHGMMLDCSHPACAARKRRFRYCTVCHIPVSKRNFSKRHNHGLMATSNTPIKTATTMMTSIPSSSSSMAKPLLPMFPSFSPSLPSVVEDEHAEGSQTGTIMTALTPTRIDLEGRDHLESALSKLFPPERNGSLSTKSMGIPSDATINDNRSYNDNYSNDSEQIGRSERLWIDLLWDCPPDFSDSCAVKAWTDRILIIARVDGNEQKPADDDGEKSSNDENHKDYDYNYD